MATVVNNPGDSGGSSAGWAVAVVILLVVIVGGIVWYTRYRSVPAQPAGINVDVNLPTGGDSGGSGGGGAPAPTQ